jgi:hypothetical protein
MKASDEHCLLPESDGDQVLDFYFIEPREFHKRYICRPEFAGKMYTQFEPEESMVRPGKRAFGRANSAAVFETAQLIDKNCSPYLALFYADASFSGQHRSMHPIYCT